MTDLYKPLLTSFIITFSFAVWRILNKLLKIWIWICFIIKLFSDSLCNRFTTVVNNKSCCIDRTNNTRTSIDRTQNELHKIFHWQNTERTTQDLPMLWFLYRSIQISILYIHLWSNLIDSVFYCVLYVRIVIPCFVWVESFHRCVLFVIRYCFNQEQN